MSQRKAVFLLGNVHGQLGGPARTILGYAEGLSSAGYSVTVAGQGSQADLFSAFRHPSVDQLTSIPFGTLSAFSEVRRAVSCADVTIVVGVWHPVFVMAALWGRIYRKRSVLVPTMSLTPFDWRKHRIKKILLFPLIALCLRLIRRVAFASTGELLRSFPKWPIRGTTILHPILIEHETPTCDARPIDLLYVGRVDPQKDLSLLLAAVQESRLSGVTIAGSGNEVLVTDLKREASALGIDVDWLGWLDRPSVLDLYTRSKVVVVTSVIENFCHVAAEALASGCSLVLVDRVLSAPDFLAFSPVTVVKADTHAIAAAISRAAADFNSFDSSREHTKSEIRRVCSPTSAASRLLEFAGAAS